MWLFLIDGFFSVVRDRADPKKLLVRARRREHLETHFPGHEIHETPDNDYRFRLTTDRETVANWVGDYVRNIAYPNFKDNIRDPGYRWAATNVWKEMAALGDPED